MAHINTRSSLEASQQIRSFSSFSDSSQGPSPSAASAIKIHQEDPSRRLNSSLKIPFHISQTEDFTCNLIYKVIDVDLSAVNLRPKIKIDEAILDQLGRSAFIFIERRYVENPKLTETLKEALILSSRSVRKDCLPKSISQEDRYDDFPDKDLSNDLRLFVKTYKFSFLFRHLQTCLILRPDVSKSERVAIFEAMSQARYIFADYIRAKYYYFGGDGGRRNPPAALSTLTRLVREKNYTPAKILLSYYYFNTEKIPHFKLSIELLSQAANDGDRSALYTLGLMNLSPSHHFRGTGFQQNRKLGFELIRESANAGYWPALNFVKSTDYLPEETDAELPKFIVSEKGKGRNVMASLALILNSQSDEGEEIEEISNPEIPQVADKRNIEAPQDSAAKRQKI